MPRKSRPIASVSKVLASLLVLGLAIPNCAASSAHAGESAQRQSDELDHSADHRSLVIPGQLVRIADANASCEPKPPAAVDLKAVGDAIRIQVVHRSRLEAELQGRDQIVLPAALQSEQGVDPVASALRDEQAVFTARRDALATQTAALTQDKAFSQREIELTAAKEAALERQEALAQKELDKIGGLMNEGLVGNQQKLALQQNILQSEANDLDVKLALLKAQQDVSKIDRGIADLRNQWRNDSLAEFNKTVSTLAELLQQARAAASAANESSAESRQASKDRCAGEKESLYVIVRGPDGAMQAFPVASTNGDTSMIGVAGAVTAQNGQ